MAKIVGYPNRFHARDGRDEAATILRGPGPWGPDSGRYNRVAGPDPWGQPRMRLESPPDMHVGHPGFGGLLDSLVSDAAAQQAFNAVWPLAEQKINVKLDELKTNALIAAGVAGLAYLSLVWLLLRSKS